MINFFIIWSIDFGLCDAVEDLMEDEVETVDHFEKEDDESEEDDDSERNETDHDSEATITDDDEEESDGDALGSVDWTVDWANAGRGGSKHNLNKFEDEFAQTFI